MCLFFLHKYINTCRIGVCGLDKNHGENNEACLKQEHILGRTDNDIVWKTGINYSEIKSDSEELGSGLEVLEVP